MKQEKVQLFRQSYSFPIRQELIGTFNSLQEAQAFVTSHAQQFEGYSTYYNIIG